MDSKLHFPPISLKIIFPFLIICSSTFPFYPSLHGELVFDDLPAVGKNPDLDIRTNLSNIKTLVNIFRHDFWGEDLKSSSSHKSYRPITTISFWIQKLALKEHSAAVVVGGRKDPAGSTFQFHLFNVCLHSLNSLLVFHIFRKFFFQIKNSFFASLIFSLHPVHVESVSGLVGRADLLYSFVVLSGLLIVPEHTSTSTSSLIMLLAKASLVSLLCLIATLCKELGIMLIPMALALEVLINHKVKIFLTFQLPECARIKNLLIKSEIISLASVAFLNPII